MLSKTIKYSTSIMTDNNKGKVIVFEILNRIFEFVLHTWSLIGLWIWLRALVHAQSHAHHLPTRPRSGLQSLDFRKGLERPWPSHADELATPQSTRWVTQQGPLAHLQFRYQANPGTCRSTICSLGWQPMGKENLLSHPSWTSPSTFTFCSRPCKLSSLFCPSLYDGNKNTINKRAVWLAHFFKPLGNYYPLPTQIRPNCFLYDTILGSVTLNLSD